MVDVSYVMKIFILELSNKSVEVDTFFLVVYMARYPAENDITF